MQVDGERKNGWRHTWCRGVLMGTAFAPANGREAAAKGFAGRDGARCVRIAFAEIAQQWRKGGSQSTALPPHTLIAAAARGGERKSTARGSGDQTGRDLGERALGLSGRLGGTTTFLNWVGIHSMATAIVARVEEELGSLPPLSLFLQAATIEAQAVLFGYAGVVVAALNVGGDTEGVGEKCADVLRA